VLGPVCWVNDREQGFPAIAIRPGQHLYGLPGDKPNEGVNIACHMGREAADAAEVQGFSVTCRC